MGIQCNSMTIYGKSMKNEWKFNETQEISIGKSIENQWESVGKQ